DGKPGHWRKSESLKPAGGAEVQPIGSSNALNSARSWPNFPRGIEVFAGGVGDGCGELAGLALLGVCSTNFSALAATVFSNPELSSDKALTMETESKLRAKIKPIA